MDRNASPDPDTSHLDPMDKWEYDNVPCHKAEIKEQIKANFAPGPSSARSEPLQNNDRMYPAGSPTSVDSHERIAFLPSLWTNPNYQQLCLSLEDKTIDSLLEDNRYPWGSWNYASEYLPPAVHIQREGMVQALELDDAEDPDSVVSDPSLLLHMLLVVGMLARDIERCQFCNLDPDKINNSVPEHIRNSVSSMSDIDPLEEIMVSLAEALPSLSPKPIQSHQPRDAIVPPTTSIALPRTAAEFAAEVEKRHREQRVEDSLSEG
ncbi:hypothetical protein K474DRAFT_1709602 [Panus rudis PR-1116 ss-1]|nr:hypothetical protein K474DRAFT_1709602 [Panus rudis PR-1116 ss-1]